MPRFSHILTFIFLFFSGLSAGEITFVVIPDTLPANAQIYITGNHTELAEWDPQQIPLERLADNRWQTTLEFDPGTQLKFKFTLGSWDSEAVDNNGIEYADFSFTVANDTDLIFYIPNWRNLLRGLVTISKQRFQNKIGQIELVDDWRFKSGDNLTWADPEYNDSDWQWRNPRIIERDRWIGIGWFRIHLKVDSQLVNRPLGLFFRQIGASEIYLNGEKIYTIGTVGSTDQKEEGYVNRNPMVITFRSQNEHLLAIRHSNFSARNYEYLGIPLGFRAILIENLQNYIAARADEIRVVSVYQMIFSILPLTLALIHLFLYIFYSLRIQNLYFALCMVGFAGLAYADFQYPFTTSVASALLFENLGFLAVNMAVFFGLLTTRSIIKNTIPWVYYLFGGFQLAMVIWVFIYPLPVISIFFFILFAIAIIEVTRIGFSKSLRDNWIMGLGLSLLVMAVAYQILLDYGLVPLIFGNRVIYVYGILSLSIAVSINLAQDFAGMHSTLLEREREKQEREIQRRILEADNERKTKEIEEARRLQLSMLPAKVPETENLDIAVFMDTATEVGGDYYDFYVDEDKSVTMAIGDATGHGLKAGIMVALVKNIFNSIGRTFYLPDFLNHCARMIKKMNLGNLYMSLLIVRIKRNSMTVAGAGMPPLYIHRANSGNLEEIVHKSLPLGGPEVAYTQSTTKLNTGDSILLMTDGYFEWFNKADEILDLNNVKKFFSAVAGQTPGQIIDSLMQKGREWSQGRAHHDDISFMVIKVK